MNKIEFQDYPSTETPLNAENLNQMQDNIETYVNGIKGIVLWENPNGTKIKKGGKNTEVEIDNMPNLSAYIGKKIKMYYGYANRGQAITEFYNNTDAFYFHYVSSYNGSDVWITNFTLYNTHTSNWIFRTDNSIGINSNGAVSVDYGNDNILVYKIEVIE